MNEKDTRGDFAPIQSAKKLFKVMKYIIAKYHLFIDQKFEEDVKDADMLTRKSKRTAISKISQQFKFNSDSFKVKPEDKKRIDLDDLNKEKIDAYFKNLFPYDEEDNTGFPYITGDEF